MNNDSSNIMTAATLDPLLKDLNPDQQQAVTHTRGPMLVIAGAGSGKTRVIVHRIAYLLSRGVKPWQLLAVTFTNKAAAQMRQRVDALVPGLGAGVWVSTFHSFCAKILRMEASIVGINPHFLIYDDSDQKQLIKETIRELGMDEKKIKPQVLLGLIGKAKDDLIDTKSYEIHSLASNDPFRTTVSKVYRRYQEKLEQASALDFGDLILKTTEAFRDNEVLRAKYNQRFQHLLVDEYQDTNRAQYLLTKYLAGESKNICVVGDPDQSIYSWRGADIRNILEFEQDYPKVKVVKLEQNYRSSPNILDASGRLIKHNQRRAEKTLWTERIPGDPIQVHELANEAEEAVFVTREMESLTQSGRRLSDCAVFYRTNAQSRAFEDALRRAEIPYRLVGTVRFYERSEVKDILAYLRVITNPNDNLSLKRVINVPARGIGKTSLETLEAFALQEHITLHEAVKALDRVPNLGPRVMSALRDFAVMLDELMLLREKISAQEMTRLVLDRTGYIKALEEEHTTESEARVLNVKELVTAVGEFEERSDDKSSSGFLEQVSLITDLDSADEEDRVTLMTLHLAKGLEFPVVFVTGLEEGILPIGDSAYSEEELEEERRLCYVGMTRARDRLYGTYAASRKLYGQAHWNMPSRFLDEAGLMGVAIPRPHQETYSVSPMAPISSERTPSGFSVGRRVRHLEFGEGKIIEKSGSGESLKVVVLFDSGTWKKLLVKYANLEKI